MGDDMHRGSGYHGTRKSFGDRGQNYSPSTSYNYNPAGHGGGNRDRDRDRDQQNRRRTPPDRFKRDILIAVERLAKQNDTMIKLLKEIRDRLDAPERHDSSGTASSPVHDETPSHQDYADTGEVHQFDDPDEDEVLLEDEEE